MKIALIGYGKMGKAIEDIVKSRGHNVCATYNSQNPVSVEKLKLCHPDVAIEFTQPHLAVSHIQMCVSANTPVVVGTTAWMHDFPGIEDFIIKNNGALLYASNFSIGVNLFYKLNNQLAKMMNKHHEYNVSVEETHHVQKIDSPSGTAVTLTEGLLEELEFYNDWKLIDNQKPSDNTIPVSANRIPEVPGTHIVKYESEIDILEIKHEAKNRKGFALGAVIAAEFLNSKKGIFTMSDVLNL